MSAEAARGRDEAEADRRAGGGEGDTPDTSDNSDASDASDTSGEGGGPRERWRRVGRALLSVGGLVGLYLLGRHVGWSQVLEEVRRALPWVPALVAVEGARLVVEGETLRRLFAHLGEPPPRRATLRAQVMAYWVFVLSPMGRLAAELTKATILAGRAGKDVATAVACQAQAAALVGTALLSVPCALAATLHPNGWPLALPVWAQTAGVLFGGLLMLWGLRRRNVGRWLGKLLGWVGLDEERREAFADLVQALPRLPWRAVLGFTLSRGLTVALFALILLALDADLTAAMPWRAMGVSLLGAAAVDVVPADIGLTEGAFALFHEQVGVSAAVGVSMGLLFHATQLVWVALSAAAALVWRDR